MNSTLPAELAQMLSDGAIGAGFAAQTGCRIVAWKDGYAELELDIEARHLNRGGTVHGGVLATLIDVTGALAGLYTGSLEHQRKAVTLSLNISYTGQVSAGRLRARGKVQSAGRSVFFSRTEVFDDEGRPIAHGDAVNRYRQG
ncbi:PaaI family thioesterase [Castellaniella sp. FW104-16D08]|uniref:PaaI family thioesterase n=1 Tax=unclassified Castellaniella TaxID=2617606 RepID=UPI0033159B60